MSGKLVLGTRGSALALAQVELTKAALARAFPELIVEVQTFITRGDQKLDLSLLRGGEAGGKGLFTKELEDALLGRRIDVAVHSLKDLPGHLPDGLEITAVLERASTADVLVSKHPGGFEGLPQGALIGTSSIRRARQLRWRRPDCRICEWRGNVPTRLRKLGESSEVDAIVLAEAGLARLRESAASFEVTSLSAYLLPAIGQGAIALQSRPDPLVIPFLQAIDHRPTHLAIRAEREVQRLLAGDCTLPVGVRTTLEHATLHLDGILFDGDAEQPRVGRASGPKADPEAVGRELARQLGAC